MELIKSILLVSAFVAALFIVLWGLKVLGL
jgi:hypothetical protein